MPATASRTSKSSKATTLEHERALAAAHGVRFIGAADEVGRGALAGPISVGVTVIDIQAVTEFPQLRDSKLLTAAKREELVGPVRAWAAGYGVGMPRPRRSISSGSPGRCAWPAPARWQPARWPPRRCCWTAATTG